MYRVLVLGIRGSGKQTLLKQLRILYGVGFTDEDCVAFREAVYNATVESFKNVIASMKSLEVSSGPQFPITYQQ